MTTDLLQEQIQYYRARTPEYDEWFYRQGRYYRGEAHKKQWLSEIATLEAALSDTQPQGNILELACGTGLWTQHLAPVAYHLVAVDASPEALAINQHRIYQQINQQGENQLKRQPVIDYVEADLFQWKPAQQFDFIFFGFWLSHVPADHWTNFWDMVQTALKPQGQIFFVDSLLNQASTAQDHIHLNQQGYAERKLNDGRTYRIVKRFYLPAELQAQLQDLGWQGQIQQTPNFFLYGCFRRPD
jgi:SAM-dependent methyltransferase